MKIKSGWEVYSNYLWINLKKRLGGERVQTEALFIQVTWDRSEEESRIIAPQNAIYLEKILD